MLVLENRLSVCLQDVVTCHLHGRTFIRCIRYNHSTNVAIYRVMFFRLSDQFLKFPPPAFQHLPSLASIAMLLNAGWRLATPPVVSIPSVLQPTCLVLCSSCSSRLAYHCRLVAPDVPIAHSVATQGARMSSHHTLCLALL